MPITINAASLPAAGTVELRALEFGRASVNRTKTPPLASVAAYLEYWLNESLLPDLINQEASAATAAIAEKLKTATDAERTAAEAAVTKK